MYHVVVAEDSQDIPLIHVRWGDNGAEVGANSSHTRWARPESVVCICDDSYAILRRFFLWEQDLTEVVHAMAILLMSFTFVLAKHIALMGFYIDNI